MMREWRWTNFNYGLSDSSRFSALDNSNGSFDNQSFGIDVRSEPGTVKLGFDNFSSITTATKTFFVLDLTKYGLTGFRAFTDDGKVYDENGSVLYTFTAGFPQNVYSAAVLNVGGTDYVYCFAENTIHRATINFGTVIENHLTPTNNSSNRHPLLEVNGKIYFGGNNRFNSLDNTETLTTLLVVPEGEMITGITFYQDLFSIYTSGRESTSYTLRSFGCQYKFREGDAQYTYRQRWDGLPVQSAASLGQVDYIVTGQSVDFSDLYLITGTQKQLVRSNLEGGGRKFLPYMCTRLDDLYLGYVYSSDYQGVLRYGSYFPGLPTALTPDFNLNDKEVYGVFIYSDYIAISTKTLDNQYKVKLFDMKNAPATKYASTGQIVSLPFNGGTNISSKSILEIELGLNPYNITKQGAGSITLYARKSKNDSWVQLDTFTADNLYKRVITKAMMPAFGTWNEITFRVELIGSTTNTPGFMELYLRYDDNISN